MSSTLWMFAKGSDVKKLQQLLNQNNALPKLTVDGIFGNNTGHVVRMFQRINGLNDDGIVGPQTWKKLGVVDIFSSTPFTEQDSSTGAVTENDEEFCFPFSTLPARSWTTGGRQFGAWRSNRTRKHAGCDLIFPQGTPIHAVADGVLTRDEYFFYTGTYAVEIRHGNLLLRYGEIDGGSYIGGRSVKKGQVIARVGRLTSGSSMLHLEMYTNASSSASLTTRGGNIYRRRSDLTDPAPYLNIWKNNLPIL